MSKRGKSRSKSQSRSRSRSRSPSPPPAEYSDSDDSMSTSSSFRSSASGQRVSTSQICNLMFPVPRVKAMLKVNHHASRVSSTAAVFLTAVLEYCTTELLELSVNAAKSDGTNRINPKHINTALKSDREFLNNFKDASVVSGGFYPFHRQDPAFAKAMNAPDGVAVSRGEMKKRAKQDKAGKTEGAKTRKSTVSRGRKRGR